MLVTTSIYTHKMGFGFIQTEGKPDVHPSVHIPTVYETIEAEPARWEYHVLTVDPREVALPDKDQLNALGKEGWILVGILNEKASGALIHYYFARQAVEQLKEG